MQFVDALVADADEIIQNLKGAYGFLKESIANNDADEKKKPLANNLSDAVKSWDAKMKAIRKAMPAPASDTNAEAKAKAKAKGRAKRA